MAIESGIAINFTEVGKIKIGGKGEHRKSKEGKDYQIPVRYDHFVITTTERDPKTGNFIPDLDLMKKLDPGMKPKEIPIRLMFDSIDMNFWTSFQYYHGNKCACRGNGLEAQRWDKNGIETKVKCDPYKCEFLKPDARGQTKCKPSGILSCQIPMSMEAGGVYRFRTHSWYSVSGILAALNYISENTNGILQGLPFKLRFLKKSTTDHGNVNIVTIVLDGEMMETRKMAFLEFENRKQLGMDMKRIEDKAKAIGFLEDTEEPESVQTEFYPEIDNTADPESGTGPEDIKEKLESKPQEKQDDSEKKDGTQKSLL